MRQGELFRLPRAVPIKLTLTQKGVLDWVAFHEGQAAPWPRSWARKTLRILIAKKLVMVTAHSPARYMLTSVGRLARSPAHKPAERLPFSESALALAVEE